MELTAFRAECAAADDTLAQVPPQAWARPGLGSWTVAQLVAHLVRAVSRVTAYADQPVPVAPPIDRAGYYRYDVATVAPGVAERAVVEARKVEAQTLPALFAEAWRRDADRAEALGAGRLLASAFGPVRVDEFLATRVLEVTVHHLDLRAALDLPAAVTPDAGRVTVDLLETLLGGPRPRNLGRVRFLQAATGRVPSDDPRFPVLG